MAIKIVVIGAGITGLTAAYELHERAKRERRPIELLVLESANRVGGKVVTEVRDGAVIEGGPDSFIAAKPAGIALVKELGLESDLIATNPAPRTIFVVSGGRLVPLPDGTGLVPTKLVPFLRSGLLTLHGRLRALLEPLVPANDGHEDETIGAFARRRLGPEAADKILGPMLAGIYAGDPDQLSIQSTFPQLLQMEKSGGLLRSIWSRKPGAGGPSSHAAGFVTLKSGLQRLVEALALRLPPGAVKTGQAVESIRRRNGKWELKTPAGLVSADAVIATIPANKLAPAIADLDLELSCVLGEIPFTSTATVSLLYDRKEFSHPLDGFGFLVPKSEGRATAAATFTSTKFPARAPEGQVFVRSFVGGAGRHEHAEADDAQIARAARAELKELLGLGDCHPKATRVFKWTKANPQYTVGHSLRMKRIESCLQGHRGLVLAGCSYYGVGLPDCIAQGREAAGRALRAATGRGAPSGAHSREAAGAA